MGLSIGLTGLPNVGKSTIFNALTGASAEASNYPFCTINKNIGIAEVPDERLSMLAGILKPGQVIPTTITFVDIAGLVKGASSGEGLGNRFLSHIRETDAILHVLRQFGNPDVSHVHGEPDAHRDADVVTTELLMADLEVAEKSMSKLKTRARLQAESEMELLRLLEKVISGLSEGKQIINMAFDDRELILMKGYAFLTAKPLIFVLNVDEEPGAVLPGDAFTTLPILSFSAKIEEEIMELPPEERDSTRDELGLTGGGRRMVIEECCKVLDLITFYTVENEILQAWSIRTGTKAPEAAGKIHSDMEKGFIRAEVVSSSDVVEKGPMRELARAGKIRSEGKGYALRDGDVCRFLFNR